LTPLRVVTSPPLTLAGWLRHDVVRGILAELDGVRSVLEIGAGEGAFGVRLADRYEYVGLEPDPRSFAVARRRIDTLARGTVLNGGVELLGPEVDFDLVCAFEVLEHQPDPIDELCRWRDRMRRDGRLLLSVPAGVRLRASDLRVGHCRRYTPARLATELEAAGLELVRLERFGFPLGYLLEFLRNVVAVSRPTRETPADGTRESGRWLQPPGSLGWGTRALTAPFRLAQRNLPTAPVGTSIVALARRAPDSAV
jgi:SAM-dependent methyltransferase